MVNDEMIPMAPPLVPTARDTTDGGGRRSCRGEIAVVSRKTALLLASLARAEEARAKRSKI